MCVPAVPFKILKDKVLDRISRRAGAEGLEEGAVFVNTIKLTFSKHDTYPKRVFHDLLVKMRPLRNNPLHPHTYTLHVCTSCYHKIEDTC